MPKFTIKSDNQTVECEKDTKIIKLSEERELGLLFGCRNGACGTCLIKVLEHPENLSPMQDSEKEMLEAINAARDERLACQCRILGDVVIDVVE